MQVYVRSLTKDVNIFLLFTNMYFFVNSIISPIISLFYRASSRTNYSYIIISYGSNKDLLDEKLLSC